MLKRFAVVLLISTVVSAQHSGNSTANFDGKSWWQYVKVLAADDMEGRETGSAGLHKAEAYIVEQLEKDGLQPAGVNGFYQPVKLISRQIDESGSSLALVRNGASEPLVLGQDAYFSTHVALVPRVEAPLVFVGYGLRVLEKNHDDYAGLDLKDKVAVVISGSPGDMPAPLASHAQAPEERYKTLRELGAIGIVTIPNPASLEAPWARIALARTAPTMSLTDPKLDSAKGIALAVIFNPAHAEKLFQGSGHTFDEIAALAKDRKQLPRFPLTVTIQARTTVTEKNVESENIIAKLPGTDRKLKDEYVVLSAHMDHLGIGAPVNGHAIYNGAMDNAAGCALMLDIADYLHRMHTKLDRSVLFTFVTAEEKGLLGSEYFAAYPTVSKKSMIANINTDMFLPIFPLKVLTVYGLAESTLGDMVTQVARADGVDVQPDPEPLRNAFIRSDQYSFVRIGVPALVMQVGFKPGSPEAVTAKTWMAERYHSPTDDLQQPVDLQAAGKFEDIVEALAVKVADDRLPPRWKSDSFFRHFATKPEALGSPLLAEDDQDCP
jgi:Zn-dependent M28 family amino/carboxypeptidase